MKRTNTRMRRRGVAIWELIMAAPMMWLLLLLGWLAWDMQLTHVRTRTTVWGEGLTFLTAGEAAPLQPSAFDPPEFGVVATSPELALDDLPSAAPRTEAAGESVGHDGPYGVVEPLSTQAEIVLIRPPWGWSSGVLFPTQRSGESAAVRDWYDAGESVSIGALRIPLGLD